MENIMVNQSQLLCAVIKWRTNYVSYTICNKNVNLRSFECIKLNLQFILYVFLDEMKKVQVEVQKVFIWIEKMKYEDARGQKVSHET